MATTEKNNVIVELYDLSITERKDDRFGRVVILTCRICSLNEQKMVFGWWDMLSHLLYYKDL